MEPLVVLLVIFTLTALIAKFIKQRWMPAFSGRMAMSVMLLFTAIGHFLFPEGMALMIPEFIPNEKELIYLTGVIEIAAAIGLLFLRSQRLTAWLLILFFIMILPANIYAAIHHVNIKMAAYDGPGVNYLWFRIPLQLFFIAWVYYFGIKKAR